MGPALMERSFLAPMDRSMEPQLREVCISRARYIN